MSRKAARVTTHLPKTPKIDNRRATDLVMQMMAIPGKSCEESQIAQFIVDTLKAAGVPSSAIFSDNVHKKSPAGGERGNLIVKLPGTKRSPRRLMMAHIDTVPLCVGARPVRKGNRVTSRDSDTALGADDRAGAAVVLTAALEILRQGLPHPPLTLFWPVQEENGLYGARFVSHQKLGNPKLCFNWDGFDASMVCIGATGDYSIDVTIDGIASHAGGHPEQGVSAIVIAGIAIADLQENGWHGLVIKGKNAGASNIGMVSGGDATNVVAPSTRLKAEVRSHNPKFRKRMLWEFEKAFKRAAKSVKNDKGKSGKIRFESALKYESFQLDASETVVQETVSALESMGHTGELRVSNGGLDANWMSSRGLPTVTLGCGQMNPHTVNEALDLDMFREACRIAAVLATRA